MARIIVRGHRPSSSDSDSPLSSAPDSTTANPELPPPMTDTATEDLMPEPSSSDQPHSVYEEEVGNEGEVSDGSTPEPPSSSPPEVPVRRSSSRATRSSVTGPPKSPPRRVIRSAPDPPKSPVLGRFGPITRAATRASTRAPVMGPPSSPPRRMTRSKPTSKIAPPSPPQISPLSEPEARSTHTRVTKANNGKKRWDDWVPQDRLRKLTDDNRELASDLRREAQASDKSKTPKSATLPRKRAQDSEFGSGRGSEDPHGAGPAGKGGKRGRDNDIEKVGNSSTSKRSRKAVFNLGMVHNPDGDDVSPESSSKAFSVPSPVVPNPGPLLPTNSEATGPAHVTSTPEDSVQSSQSEVALPSDPADLKPSTVTANPYEVRRSTRTRKQVQVQYNPDPNRCPPEPAAPKPPSPSDGAIPLIAKRIIHGVYDDDGVYYPGKQILSVHAYYKFGFHCPDLESATKNKMARMLEQAKKKPSPVTAERREVIKKEKLDLDEGIEALIVRGVSQMTINALRTPLPYEEPEYMLKSTARTNFHWAPVGPHTLYEKAQILKLADEAGVLEQPAAPQPQETGG